MEGTSDPAPERVSDATDSFAEQDLEVEGRSRTALLPPTGNGEQGARPPEGGSTARREQAVVTRYGCERGELFGGSKASRGARPVSPRHAWRTTPVARRSASRERVSAKRGEPHDRQRGATNPRTSVRRKPSRWCETTRAERELDGWCRRPEGVSGQLGALGVDAQESCRWRGGQVTNPKRGWVSVPGRSFGSGSAWPRGTRPVCGRFEGDGRSWSADDGLYRLSARFPVKSSRAPDR